MKEKLFERLVTKFAVKVNDLAKYLEISKATIYNYRNLENFSDIPSDKQYKIFYLFGKKNVEELELVLEESDNDMLTHYTNRISGILKESIQEKKESIASVESLTAKIEQLSQDNLELRQQLSSLSRFAGIDEFARMVILNKTANIVEKANAADIRHFIDYLEIYETYKNNIK